MLVPTHVVVEYLESKGFDRYYGRPFDFYVWRNASGVLVDIDEGHGWQDIRHLLEDWEQTGKSDELRLGLEAHCEQWRKKNRP